MMENLQFLLNEAATSIKKAYEHTQTELAKFKVAKVHRDMISHIQIDHYGVPSPLEQIANITIRDTATLLIKPWDKKLLPIIEKAIREKNEHGFITNSDGDMVYATRPLLTEETRRGFVKQIDAKAEEGKVAIRNIRKRIKEKIKAIKAKDEVSKGEKELQTLIDEWIEHIATLQKEKKEAIMKL